MNTSAPRPLSWRGMLTLRPYQIALIQQARERIVATGKKRILIQAATGAGKTVLIAQMLANAAAKGKKAWFLVHRNELLEQSVATFRTAAEIQTGVIAAGYTPDTSAPVHVCSVQSLQRRLATLDAPDLVVYDEAHHCAAGTWAAIAERFPTVAQIGLTATPQRLDGYGLRDWFDELIVGPSTAELIAAGFLAPYTLFAPTASGPDMGGVRKTAGDYNRQQMAATMQHSTVVGDALDYYIDKANNGRALVFMWSLDASRQLAARFIEAGIAAQHVDGETPRAERQDAMARFRSGELRVILNVDLFGEGLDVPSVDAVFLLRPTQSLGLYLQQVGRGLRMAAGKTAVKIFDHAGNWTRHGLPDDPRDWSLDGELKGKKKKAAPALRRCMDCFAVSPASAECCRECGAEFPKKPRPIQQVNGTLSEWREMSNMPTPIVRVRSLAHWQAEAKRLGYKPGWAWYRFRAQNMRRSA